MPWYAFFEKINNRGGEGRLFQTGVYTSKISYILSKLNIGLQTVEQELSVNTCGAVESSEIIKLLTIIIIGEFLLS